MKIALNLMWSKFDSGRPFTSGKKHTLNCF